MWTAPVTVSPPSSEPIALADAKTFLRIDGDDLDQEVARSIAGARGAIERRTGTRLMTQTVEVAADCFADLEQLPVGPVRSVIAIDYLDPGRASETLPSDSYELFGAGLDRGIRPAIGASWPSVARLRLPITVRLEVGYDNLPADVELALWGALRAVAEDRPIDVDALIVNHRIWA